MIAAVGIAWAAALAVLGMKTPRSLYWALSSASPIRWLLAIAASFAIVVFLITRVHPGYVLRRRAAAEREREFSHLPSDKRPRFATVAGRDPGKGI